MKRRRLKSWRQLAMRWTPFLVGGLALQPSLGGCDANVKDAALTGIQTTLVALPTQLINALVQAFQNALSGTTTQPTAKAVFENLHQWFA